MYKSLVNVLCLMTSFESYIAQKRAHRNNSVLIVSDCIPLIIYTILLDPMCIVGFIRYKINYKYLLQLHKNVVHVTHTYTHIILWV